MDTLTNVSTRTNILFVLQVTVYLRRLKHEQVRSECKRYLLEAIDEYGITVQVQ